MALYRFRPGRRLRSGHDCHGSGDCPPRSLRESSREVADALQSAHRKGLVHRDVKPANILLDRDGNVFLTDFGIAVTQEQLQSGAAAGEGTLAYMAPEQLAAADGQIGPQSDIYSLGVVLYELLTERRPARRTDLSIRPQEPCRLETPPGGNSDGLPPPLHARSLDPGRTRCRLPACLGGNPDRPIFFGGRVRPGNPQRGRQDPAAVASCCGWPCWRAWSWLLGAALVVVGKGSGSRGHRPRRLKRTCPRMPPLMPASGRGRNFFEGCHYKYIPATVNWHEAQRRCEEMGGSLVMIKSRQEQEFIAEMLGSEPGYVLSA